LQCVTDGASHDFNRGSESDASIWIVEVIAGRVVNKGLLPIITAQHNEYRATKLIVSLFLFRHFLLESEVTRKFLMTVVFERNSLNHFNNKMDHIQNLQLIYIEALQHQFRG
jgi:hypothetical protein